MQCAGRPGALPGLFQFLTKQLSIDTDEDKLSLAVQVTHGPDRSDPEVMVQCSGTDYSGIEAQEVLKRLQSSRSILFHNSTQVDPRFPFRHHFGGIIRAESPEHETLVTSMKKTVNRGLSKIAPPIVI